MPEELEKSSAEPIEGTVDESVAQSTDDEAETAAETEAEDNSAEDTSTVELTVESEVEDDQDEEAREIVFRPRQRTKIYLDWIVKDFDDHTESVYEAIMIASHRARQIGRMHKAEVDEWSSAVEALESEGPVEDAFEIGVDQFNHSKPTIVALHELDKGKIKYKYLEKAE